jgi:cytochrome c-type biogenesis protein CcmH
MKIRNKLVLVFTLLGMLGTAAPALAQEPLPTPSDDEVNAIAKNLYCPVCENIPLDVCPTQACADWREEIRDLLVQGLTEEEIYDYFVERYGDRVLAEPPRRGLNWLVYILPPIVFLVGAYILYRGFRSWRKPVEELAGETPLPSGEEKDEYVSRLEEELKRRQ